MMSPNDEEMEKAGANPTMESYNVSVVKIYKAQFGL
jgi:hypothetical protein